MFVDGSVAMLNFPSRSITISVWGELAVMCIEPVWPVTVLDFNPIMLPNSH